MSAFRTTATVLCLTGLTVTGLIASATPASAGNRSLESIHQPVVTRTDFVFDIVEGSLTDREEARLIAWLDALSVGYGDQVSINAPAGLDVQSTERVAALIGRYGLLLSTTTPVTAASPVGAPRVVVSRATAAVPGCPDWDDKAETDLSGGVTSNYGCAINSTFAAMIANPDDLVRGATTRSDLRTATSNRAIKTWAEKPPTGAGELKAETTGGQ